MRYLLLLVLLGCSTTDNPTTSNSNCVEVRGLDGAPLGPKLTLARYCNLQLQGSGIINGDIYGYAGKSDINRVDCSHISKLISGRVKFAKSKRNYIVGNKSNRLTPMKSIAADQSVIPFKTKVFIPQLKGIKYSYDNKSYIHDGNVSVEDTGGAIKSNHIDFYLGVQSDVYKAIRNFPFIKSEPIGLFKAIINGKETNLWATAYYIPAYKACK
jgi:3D (Asp-Asp-Asp) domain-containing protein